MNNVFKLDTGCFNLCFLVNLWGRETRKEKESDKIYGGKAYCIHIMDKIKIILNWILVVLIYVFSYFTYLLMAEIGYHSNFNIPVH